MAQRKKQRTVRKGKSTGPAAFLPQVQTTRSPAFCALGRVTVVGHAASISAGEWITASGDWVNDRTHGQQFKARFLRTSPPTSADGIEKYRSSEMIRGVGPVYAKKLVPAFGEKVFDIIETTPDRLREIDGIGPVRATSILAVTRIPFSYTP